MVYAVDYLTDATRSLLEDAGPKISAKGLDVVVIGGGDTGNDCVGTAVRQGARSVTQLEFLPKPPQKPLSSNPWPEWPNTLKTDYGQQEAIDLMGGEMRSWAVDTLEIERDESGAATGAVVVDLDWSAGKPRRLEDTRAHAARAAGADRVRFHRARGERIRRLWRQRLRPGTPPARYGGRFPPLRRRGAGYAGCSRGLRMRRRAHRLLAGGQRHRRRHGMCERGGTRAWPVAKSQPTC